MFEIIQKTLLTTTSIAAFVFTFMVLFDKLAFLTFAVTNREKIQKVIVGALIGSIVITVPNLTIQIIFLMVTNLFVLILTMCLVNAVANKNSKIWMGALVFVFIIYFIALYVNTPID